MNANARHTLPSLWEPAFAAVLLAASAIAFYLMRTPEMIWLPGVTFVIFLANWNARLQAIEEKQWDDFVAAGEDVDFLYK